MNALLHLTHDCNLRCPYCFTGKKFDREMTPDTAKRTAEFVVDYAKQHGQRAVFSFFGGEPMMAWDRLREVVLHAEGLAREQGVVALFRMNTNGMLIKEEHLRFFEEHDLIFILSIDGNAAMHDAERLTEGGKGSHHVLAEKLPRFLEHNPGMMASVVITPTNVRSRRGGHRVPVRPGLPLPDHQARRHAGVVARRRRGARAPVRARRGRLPRAHAQGRRALPEPARRQVDQPREGCGRALDPLRRRQLADLDLSVGQHLPVRALGEGRRGRGPQARRRVAGPAPRADRRRSAPSPRRRSSRAATARTTMAAARTSARASTTRRPAASTRRRRRCASTSA